MNFITAFFFNENTRSKLLNKNILFSVFLQGFSIVISLVLLPISLKFVSIEQYGIWLTISSILMWTANLDLGLGSGLKNSLTTALAKTDYKLAKEYISTAYIVNAIIMGLTAMLFFFASFYIHWAEIFKLNVKLSYIIDKTFNYVVFLFLARFVIQLINVILDSMQMLYVAKINNAVSQFLILVFILIYSKYSHGDLFSLGLIFSITPLAIFFGSSIIIFNKYKDIKPSFKCFKTSLIKDLYRVGFRFFFIQVSMIFLFQTSNILIIRYFGSSEVVQYNVVYNLFSMMTLTFSTISAPYWAAYTNAWALNDIDWIKKTNKKLFKIWLFIAFVTSMVLIFSDYIYMFWLKRDLHIPFKLSLAVFIYMSVFSFGGIFNMFINAVGKLKLQIITLGISTVLFFPTLWFCVKILKLGLISFPIALLVISLYTLFFAPIQFKKIINGTATGIWNQ